MASYMMKIVTFSFCLLVILVYCQESELRTPRPTISSINEFIASPQNKTILEGDSAVLRCKTRDRVYSCQWFYLEHGLDLLDKGNEPTLLMTFRPTKHNDCSIKFSKAKLSQSGQWICKGLQLQNRKYVVSPPATLKVLARSGNTTEDSSTQTDNGEEKDKSVDILFHLSDEGHLINTKLGDNVILRCQTNHQLNACSWIRPDGTTLNFNNKGNYALEGNYTIANCSLRIIKVTEEDEGNWRCVVSTDHQSDKLGPLIHLHIFEFGTNHEGFSGQAGRKSNDSSFDNCACNYFYHSSNNNSSVSDIHIFRMTGNKKEEYMKFPDSSICSSMSSRTTISTPPAGHNAIAETEGSTRTSASDSLYSASTFGNVTYDASDGSPVKTTGTKDGSKRVAIESENVGPSQKHESSPVSAMKKPTTDANAEGDGKPKSDDPEDSHLRKLYTQISEVVAANPDKLKIVNEDETEDPSAVPMIWISKWVDYCNKYGLDYQPSDDSIDVLFNDLTKLLLIPDGHERSGQEHYHRLSDFSQSICKRVTLLRYFRNYMNEHLLKAGATMAPREVDELARIPSLIADNLAKSSTPSVASEKSVAPQENPSENTSSNNPDRTRPSLIKFI
ncbi:Serine/threonine-protein kinase PLK1 [Armadillidium nasatum]|uniref:Serine/threonine-protein kinase PLK1 n=1 Tax=Armadillidium nasatum TaxID=96803 RepID=A0A5N5SLL5_9CRUS|nr:Serine/threonine-protein kinase PLK1 [Armadillidium nasatum]